MNRSKSFDKIIIVKDVPSPSQLKQPITKDKCKIINIKFEETKKDWENCDLTFDSILNVIFIHYLIFRLSKRQMKQTKFKE